jgi:two-component system, sensor histidine kinase and response regulator
MVIPPGDRERDVAVVAAVAQGERLEQYQTRRLRKDGTTVEVSLTMLEGW